MVESVTYLIIVRLLATFTICRPLDEDGKEYIPELNLGRWKNRSVQCTPRMSKLGKLDTSVISLQRWDAGLPASYDTFQEKLEDNLKPHRVSARNGSSVSMHHGKV